jgi:hypothetical protein
VTADQEAEVAHLREVIKQMGVYLNRVKRSNDLTSSYYLGLAKQCVADLDRDSANESGAT